MDWEELERLAREGNTFLFVLIYQLKVDLSFYIRPKNKWQTGNENAIKNY